MAAMIRRLPLALLGLLLPLSGCASQDPPAGPAIERIPEAEAAAGRASCRFGRGAMPWETIGEELPIGDAIPIDHIILVMQENRSFDHYFGTMPGVDGIPAGASNPDSSGAPIEPFLTDQLCLDDVSHSWNASHRQYGGGLNDGFVLTNEPNGERALGYLDGADLPFYWSLYGTFAMSDHHFCSMLGPTWVNRYYFLGGTSWGLVHNEPPDPARLIEPYLIFQLLEEAGIDWRIYHSDVAFLFGALSRFGARRLRQLDPLERFFTDLEAGTLPPVSYVDPSFFAGVDQTDEHPPANVQMGQAFIARLVEAVMASPLWERTALILTYDEHGGFYDHVPPPEACRPGDYPPQLEATDLPGDFDRLGFRVPLVVVSPFARAGHVSDRVTDHASVLRFIETRFGLPALTGRDANAWPLLDMFDFDAPPFLVPPTLDMASIDEARATTCRERFPGSGFSI